MKTKQNDHRPLPYINCKDLVVKPRSHSSNANNRKEEFQILKSNSRLPEYQPLGDKHLASFLERNRTRKHLQKIGLLKNTSGDTRLSNIIEHSLEDMPKMQKDAQFSLPLVKREPTGGKATSRNFLSKADFQQYIQAMRSKVTSVMERPLDHSLQQS